MCNGLRNQSGFATLVALAMVGLLTLLGIAAMSTSDTDVTIAGNTMHEMRAFYAAEAGLEEASAMIQEQYEATGKPPNVLPKADGYLNGCQVSYNTVDNGAAVSKVLTEGYLAGLKGLVKTYTLTSDAGSDEDRSRVVLTQEFEAAMVPLFQFAIFYDDDLLATPLQNMTISGRVHANGDIWTQAFAGLYFDNYVTSAGNMFHGLSNGQYAGLANAGVFIKDSKGIYQNMLQGGTWLDAKDKDWYKKASDRWGGRVRDKAFGQQALKLPLDNPDDPRKMIERGTSNPDSYEHKASIKFIDGKAYKLTGGVWSDVTADMKAKGIMTVTADKFTDGREAQKVDVTDIDIAKLYSNGYGPANGVIYFSEKKTGSSHWPAMRLTNCKELKGALTVASENPMYTLGDFNTVNKQPAAIMTDAYTILSKSWVDGNSTLATASRVATATAVNASFMTGDAATTSTNYGGGIENLPRFLEHWGSGTKATIRGSMVNLWQAKQATGAWSLNYYEPPARDWSYDIDLDDPNKIPPEAPKLLVFTRVGWTQQHVGID